MSLHLKTCISFDISRPTSYGEISPDIRFSMCVCVKIWLRSFSSKKSLENMIFIFIVLLILDH